MTSIYAKFVSFFIIALPLTIYADGVSIKNNTDAYGTGRFAHGLCSSSLGEKGILKPHGDMTISQTILDTNCGLFACDAYVYANKDCSGKETAKVTMEAKKGVTAIHNYDEKHFRVMGLGRNIEINSAANLY